jgi:GNAT superfamily N-acetyltransferase
LYKDPVCRMLLRDRQVGGLVCRLPSGVLRRCEVTIDASDAGPRVATFADAATVTDLVVRAFYGDPTWQWAFPDPKARADQHRSLWRIFVEGALRYPWVWLGAAAAATSVWIPPGGTDMSRDQEAMLEPLLVEMLGSGSARVLAAFEMFESAHPHSEPHYYLSLLASDPAQRGKGYGLGLLAENLRLIDSEAAAAYLEASNPVNVPLYERYGFRRLSSFDLPDDGPTVHTMWRAARPKRTGPG